MKHLPPNLVREFNKRRERSSAAGGSSGEFAPDLDEDADDGHTDHGQLWYIKVTSYLSDLPMA